MTPQMNGHSRAPPQSHGRRRSSYVQPSNFFTPAVISKNTYPYLRQDGKNKFGMHRMSQADEEALMREHYHNVQRKFQNTFNGMR